MGTETRVRLSRRARRQRAILIAKHSQDESFAEFEQVLRETEAIQERAKTGAPDEQRRARELLASAANSYGIALSADGQTDAAIKSYQRTVAILQEMEQSGPLNHQQKSSLAGTLMNLGNRLIQKSSYKDAAQSYLDSKKLYEQLIIGNPSRASNKANAVGTLIGLGITSYRANRLEQALELYQEAEDLLDRYELEHPELQGSWDRNRSTVLVNLVLCYNESEQFEKAHEVADRVIAMHRLANSADPDGGAGAKGLAIAIGNKAAIFEREGLSENALPLLKEAIGLFETALGYAPRNAEFLRSYEYDVRRLLQIYLRESDHEAMRVALEQFRRLTESDPRMLAQLLEFTDSQADAKSEEAQAVLSSFR